MTFRVGEFSTLRIFQLNNETSQYDQSRILERISTQKRINRASDHPEDFQRVRDTHASLDKADAYKSVIQKTQSSYDLVETSLDSIRESIDRVRELTVSGTSVINDADARTTVADQIQQMRENIIARLNTRDEGQYIFSGTETATAPFDTTGVYFGNSTINQIRINDTDRMPIGFTGDQIAFGAGGQGSATDVLDALQQLETAFRNNDLTTINTELPRLAPIQDRINGMIASVGTRTQRLDMEKGNFDSLDEGLQAILASLEDVDLADEVTKLDKNRTAMDSQLRAQSQLNRQSLLNYLS